MAIKEVIQKRRRLVTEMILEGYMLSEIARELGWDEKTIDKDVKAIRHELQESGVLSKEELVLQWVMRNRRRYKNASRVLRKTDNPETILRAIDRQEKADDTFADRCQQFGLMPKEATKIEMTQKIYEIKWKRSEVTVNDETGNRSNRDRLRGSSETAVVHKQSSEV